MTAIGYLEATDLILYSRETSGSTMPYTLCIVLPDTCVYVRLSISPQSAANLLQNSHFSGTKSMQ